MSLLHSFRASALRGRRRFPVGVSFVLMAAVLATPAWARDSAAKTPAGVEAGGGVEKQIVNSIGMRFRRVEAGRFRRGGPTEPLSAALLDGKGLFPRGDLDEQPAHDVVISEGFYLGVFEVTNAEYELFRPSHKALRGKAGVSSGDRSAVAFVSWYDAEAFCAWLSDKDGRSYRLPTEAEWEYACRAGTTSPFHSGEELPAVFQAALKRDLVVGGTPENAWGFHDLHGNLEEWCLDVYGPYGAGTVTNPVGRGPGDFRVLRGGSHSTLPYYLRSSNRMGTIPEDRTQLIGFRVVLDGVALDGTPDGASAAAPLVSRGAAGVAADISQEVPDDLANGPDPDVPYFKEPQPFVRIPPGSRGPLFSKHNHFISVTDCPNGDLLAIWHTCESESDRELAIAGSRLRRGADAWEPASIFWDVPDRNDHGHALWFDGEQTLYHFQGLAVRSRQVALILRTSTDNGLSWSRARIIGDHGRYRMPVESVFRAQDGRLALACDKGGSVVWLSADDGLSWRAAPGRARGIHQSVAQLSDGRLLAFGRGHVAGGLMPMSVSDDMGESWVISGSPFQAVDLGQRCVLLRLREGPLLFVSFGKRMPVRNAAGKTHEVSGLYTAVSLDDAKTWKQRRLVTHDRVAGDGKALELETMNGFPITLDAHHAEAAGYLTICQTPDGVVHLLSSRQHYAFNLKWLLSPPPEAPNTAPQPMHVELDVKEQLPRSVGAEQLLVAQPEGWTGASDAKIFELADAESGKSLRILPQERAQPVFGTHKEHEFLKVATEKGFAVEIRLQVKQSAADDCGLRVELYDGAASRYGFAFKENGVYWYSGLVMGTDTLPFNAYVPIAEGLDDAAGRHTYRFAVRPDRVVQVYRDGKLLGTRRAEYRTPREAYIRLQPAAGTEAYIDSVAYDVDGPSQP